LIGLQQDYITEFMTCTTVATYYLIWPTPSNWKRI